MRDGVVLVPPVLALGLMLLATPTGSALGLAQTDGAEETAPPPGADWRVVLERAVEASRSSTYQGRLLIAAVDAAGPTLTELDIAQGAGGGLRVGRAESWMLGRDRDGAFYTRQEAGNLLRFGNVERVDFDLDGLTRKYQVRRDGEEQLRTGDAVVLGIRERGAEHDRERLYVDEHTGLVVRRETFAEDGSARRIVAFTELEVAELTLEPPAGLTDDPRRGQVLRDESFEVLAGFGWATPRELPGEFQLLEGRAVEGPDGSTLHLVYTDGLYTLSVFELTGQLDVDAVAGADRYELGDRAVWRWPGSEPERVVWSADDLTFTIVSDAPMDVVMTAVEGLPGEEPPSFVGRLVRGLQRVGGWLWPFD